MPVSLKKKSKSGEGITSKDVSQSGEIVKKEEATEPVHVVKSGENLLDASLQAQIEVHMSATINLGDYNSARVGASITLPSDPDMVAVNKTYDVAKEWVEKKVQALADEVQGGTEEGYESDL